MAASTPANGKPNGNGKKRGQLELPLGNGIRARTWRFPEFAVRSRLANIVKFRTARLEKEAFAREFDRVKAEMRAKFKCSLRSTSSKSSVAKFITSLEVEARHERKIVASFASSNDTDSIAGHNRSAEIIIAYVAELNKQYNLR